MWSLRCWISGVIAALTVSIVSCLGLFDTIDRWIYQETVTLFEIGPIVHVSSGTAAEIPAQLQNISPPVPSALTIALITAAAFAAVGITTALRLVPALGIIILLAMYYEVIAFLASHAANRILDLGAMPAALVLGYAITVSNDTLQASWRHRSILKSFARRVPSDLAKAIWQHRDQFVQGGQLSSQKLSATVLFAEMRGFPPQTDPRNAGMLMEWLCDYRETMARLVMDHGGMVEGFFGDALKATFGVPFARERADQIGQDASRAVACALTMGEALQTVNRRWHDRAIPNLFMRIGIATGDVTVVSIGQASSLKFTTVGDIVQSATQLMCDPRDPQEPTASPCSCRILIGALTGAHLRGQFWLYPVETGGTGAAQRSDRAYRVFGKNDWVFFKDKSEPRASSRIPVMMSVTVASDPSTAGFTINVSSGGMAICRLPRPLSIGSTAMLQLDIPGQACPLKTTGTVVWAHHDQAGIAFAALPPSDQILWESFLTSQAAKQTPSAA